MTSKRKYCSIFQFFTIKIFLAENIGPKPSRRYLLHTISDARSEHWTLLLKCNKPPVHCYFLATPIIGCFPRAKRGLALCACVQLAQLRQAALCHIIATSLHILDGAFPS